MHNVFFLVTHHGSGFERLALALDANPRVQIGVSNFSYPKPADVLALRQQPHKCGNVAALYGDTLLWNHGFSVHTAHEFCKFVFLVREPRASFGRMLGRGMSEFVALEYYLRRLRRMCEMAKKSPEAMFLTYDDLGSRDRLAAALESFLCLREPLSLPPPEESEPAAAVSYEADRRAQAAYERCLFYMGERFSRSGGPASLAAAG